jgi:5'-deoxynucleotidase YfbR-like HD superfamily hydrolase
MERPDGELKVTMDPRRAGRVQRYHTWPHLKEQSVAEHSWNVARITLAICPEASPALVRHCLFHDLGEVVSGDPPYPVKLLNPAFGTEHRAVEDYARETMSDPWMLPHPGGITDEEKAIFKLAEFIEMVEWGLDERNMGNRFAEPVVDRCRTVVFEYVDGEKGAGLPADVRMRALDYHTRRRNQDG